MPRDPSMRASDGERDKVAAALQEHCAQGRLTMEEFQQRMDAAYEAKTIGDLERLTADLPAEDLYQLPVPAGQDMRLSTRARADIDHALPGGIWPWVWGAWATITAVSLALWLLVWQVTGNAFYPYALGWFTVDGVWGLGQLAAYRSDRRRRL